MVITFYFLMSLSFVYLNQVGSGQYFGMLGAALAIATEKHFMNQYKRVEHIRLVKTLVIEDSTTSIEASTQG